MFKRITYYHLDQDCHLCRVEIRTILFGFVISRQFCDVI